MRSAPLFCMVSWPLMPLMRATALCVRLPHAPDECVPSGHLMNSWPMVAAALRVMIDVSASGWRVMKLRGSQAGRQAGRQAHMAAAAG